MAVTAGIDFGAAFFINAFLDLQLGFARDALGHTILIYAVVLLLHGLLNQFGIRLVALLNDISVWWHILGVLIIVGGARLRAVPPPVGELRVRPHRQQHRLAPAPLYVVLIGLLLAQYTFTGYDASAHMTEETHKAATAGPRGIVMSIVVSLFAGWLLLIGLTFAIQNYSKRARLGDRRPARPDLHRRGRGDHRQAAAADRDRRSAVLRHVLGHRQLADDLRLLPRRRAARSRPSGTG